MNITVNKIQQAILRGDTFYNGVKLSSPQRTGTYFQQETYAYLKASEIYKKHFQNHK